MKLNRFSKILLSAMTMALVGGALPSLAQAASPEGNAYAVRLTDINTGATSEDHYLFEEDGQFSNEAGDGSWFLTANDIWIAFVFDALGNRIATYLGVTLGTDSKFIIGYCINPLGTFVLFGTKELNDCESDSDGDNLVDCVETNTGVYVSPDDTGTDPNDADTDDDDINDGDEVLGTAAGLDLPGMGANPLRKNIFIEYDWFDESLECGAHTHRPTQNVLNMFATAFANSPVSNPDGSTGITVIQDRGQGGLFTGGNLIFDADGVLTGGVNNAEFQAHKAANFDPAREGYFHYTILPHRYNTNSGSSGQAELPGDDMIVSLYCANSDTNVAHTIMHEIGHNLNLRHGGFENCNYKPNYNSVMNYAYQFPGVDNNCTPPPDGVLDYSIGDRITLNENSLNENLGTCGFGFPWDWNGNGFLENGIVFDINPPNSSCSGNFTVLDDYDDWGNLFFQGVSDADGAMPLTKEIIDCDNAPPGANVPL